MSDTSVTPSTGLPRTPPDIPPRVRRLVLGVVALAAATSALGTALSPYLLVEHPLLLIALNPDSRHLVLAANRVEFWQAVAVGSARRGFNFVTTFGLASLYGYVLISWLEEKRPWTKRVVRLVERLYAVLGIWLVVLMPAYWVAALAGIARLPLRRFCVAIVPGQIAFVFGTLYFGEMIERWTAPIIAFISQHLLESTLVCVALVVVQQLWSRLRKRRGQAPELPPIGGDPKP